MTTLSISHSSDLKSKIENQKFHGLRTSGPLLSVKELPWELKRYPSYIYAMRQAGFRMPGYRTTLATAMDWLARNPDWRKRL